MRSAIVACLLVLLGFILGVGLTDTFNADTLPPCAEEDSTACYWDAPNRGNGLGDSFINP